MRRRRYLGPLATVALLVVASVTGCSDAAPGRPAGAQRIDTYLSDLLRRHEFRGSVLVARDGSVVLSKGYGLADTATGAVDTPHTRYRIASVTKQFTALAVLKLQDLGKLRVSDRLCDYLPDCPAHWRAVTIEHLLTHTSGIPDYTESANYPAISTAAHSPDSLVALVRGRPLEFAPGSRWKYSNSGYALLGCVIERAAGASYAEFLQRQILRPLGLTETGYDTNQPDPSSHAVGYTDWSHPAAFLDMSVPYAAGALYASTTDLYRWDRFLITGAPGIVTPTALAQMFMPRVSTDPQAAKSGQYGYGWFISGPTANPTYQHDGDINGFVSLNQIRRRSQLIVIVLSNLESSVVHDIGDTITAELGG
jgi:CubicO group peptidase (beta-lactamase class C family)